MKDIESSKEQLRQIASTLSEQSRKFLKLKFIVPAITVLILAGGGIGYYFYTQRMEDPQTNSQKEITALVAQVSKFIILPQDETPTVATVSDPDKLKNQPFFVNAQVGDKVLIFTNSKKAILYRPSINKIIEVAPINLGNTTPTSTR